MQEQDVFNEISGTTGITGAMDTMLVLKKNKSGGKLFVTGRDILEKEYDVVFDKNICCWNVTEENNMTAERKQIFDILKSFGRPMKSKEIADAAGKELSNISKMLGKMVKDKIIESPKYGYYRLPEEKTEVKPKHKLKPLKLFNDSQSGKSGKTASKQAEMGE
jgi:hypothetical protein